MSAPRKLTLRCPDCDSHLVVDAATGELLHHTPPGSKPAAGRSMEQLPKLPTSQSKAK